jgi:hypothetical protein
MATKSQRKRTKPSALRSVLAKQSTDPAVKTAFDIFGSDLPDEVFDGVFDQPRERAWRSDAPENSVVIPAERRNVGWAKPRSGVPPRLDHVGTRTSPALPTLQFRGKVSARC